MGLDVTAFELEARIVRAGQVRCQEIGQALVLCARQQVLDLRANDLVLGQSEIARTDLVANTDRPGVTDGHHRFGNAIENGLDRGRCSQRLRDRRFHTIVMLIDQAQQLDEVRFLDTGRRRRLLDSIPEIPIHAPRYSSSVTRGGRRVVVPCGLPAA